jgi:hypothetical protein
MGQESYGSVALGFRYIRLTTTSFPDYLNQHPFSSPSIELAVKHLFPGTKIESSAGNRHDGLSSHDLPFYIFS